MSKAPAAEWAARGERSNLLALRLMAWIATTLGRPLARGLLHPIALYFLGTASAPRRHSRRFLARALGRPARWHEVYRHFHAFAATVLDRVYFVRGRMQAFDIRIHGVEHVDATLAEGRGAFLLGAHIGSFEALHAIGETRPGLRVKMVMYPDNARKIHRVLQALAPAFQLGIIGIGRSGSTLEIRDELDRGGLVGLLGDRFLAGDAREARHGGSALLPFLGAPARFTDGPFRLALLLRRRVIFMVALYHGGRRYEVRFLPLADFRTPPAEPAGREQALREALQAYVAQLEALAREAPLNWFNFFDYWGDDARREA
ncbi:MAG: acyl-CoA synthetase [Burkholderiales bacterium]|nr:acyl-CoA synthetase [Burkholderiales bacterium]MDE2277124.1 acyl-CoA synthetase [Burkholderiales bacterium]